MTTNIEQYSQICKKALHYREEAEKNFVSLIQEINAMRKIKDTARLDMHQSNITKIFESLKNNVVSIQILDIKKLQGINEDELELVLKGAENILSVIAHQNAALQVAIGMTEHIPDKSS